MAQLTRDRTIAFGSAEEFVQQFHANLSKDALLVQSDEAWPLRTPQIFEIRVPEVETRVSITAEVVYAAGGMVGLQIVRDEETSQELEYLLAQLEDVEEEEPAQLELEPQLDPRLETRPTTQPFPPVQDSPASAAGPGPGQTTGPRQPARGPRSRRVAGPPRVLDDARRVQRQTTGPVAPASNRRRLRRGTGRARPETKEGGRGARKGSGQFPRTGAEASYLRRAGIAPSKSPTGEQPATGRSRSITSRRAVGSASHSRRSTTGPALYGATAQVIVMEGRLVVNRGGQDFISVVAQPLTDEALAKITLPQLIATVAKAEVPLSLSIPAGDRQHVMHFNIRGNLVRYLGPDSDRDLLERLVRSGAISRELVRELLQHADDETSPEELMLHQRLIRPREYWVTVREQVIDALLAIHKAGETRFVLRSEDVRRSTGIPFGALAIPWLEAALRWISAGELDSLLADLMYKYPALVEDPPWPLAELDLDKRAFRFLESSLVGRVQLEQVRRTSPLGANRSKRLLLSLVALGMIELFDNPLLEGRKVTPEMLLVRELKKREKADRFEQLGVHWSAHPNTYQAALDKLKDEYGPTSKWGRFHPQTRAICARIIEIAGEAMRFLQQEDQRKTYRAQLVAHFQLESSAYLLFKQAEMMVMRKELSQAQDALQMCLEMAPKPAFRALLDKIGGRG
jgi:hypothetical protein